MIGEDEPLEAGVGRVRLWLTIAAVAVTVVAAGLIGWQLPVALAHSANQSELARLNAQLVSLTEQTKEVSTHQERLQTSIDQVSATNDDISRKISLQKTEISGLKDDLKRLTK